jgi:MFS family permease
LSFAGLAYFIPTIVSSYGYSPIESQIHSIPPWAAAFGYSMLLAFLSDKTRKRTPFVFFSFAMALAGVTTLFCLDHNKYAQYAALCLYTMGIFGTVPIIICWFVMNLEGHRNRAVGTAWQIAFGNMAGMISTFAFPVKDRPRYTVGYSIGIGLLCMSMLASAIYYWVCARENRRKPEGRKLIL